jgi:chemotaxis protein MotB
MPMKRIHEPPAEPRGNWLLTFNDLITLLLTFFVLILSMSNIEAVKVKGLAGSVKQVLGMPQEDKGQQAVIESVIPSLYDEEIQRRRSQQEPASGAMADRRTALAKAFEKLGGQRIVPYRNGLLLSLNEQILFAPGTAEITAGGRDALLALGEILKRTEVSVRVEGHTDDRPIAAGRYPSNWELSLARAVHVVKYFVTECGVAPERLSAVGYADTRPRVENRDAQSRQLNRRVDIVLTFPEN